MEIKELGIFHAIDKDGFIKNPCRYPVLQKEYSDAISEILDWYKKLYGSLIHSVYLRGSIAKGQAIHNVSDIDIIVLTNGHITKPEKEKREQVDKLICSKYKFITGVEMHFEQLSEIKKQRVQFLLKTQCVCIYGTDVIPSLKQFKPGKDGFAHLPVIIKDIDEIMKEFKEGNTKEEIKKSCIWIMKRIVRSGFELVMEKDKSYSRDLYPNYQRFIAYYPEMAEKMRVALELAINPTDDVNKIISCINVLRPFFAGEIGK